MENNLPVTPYNDIDSKKQQVEQMFDRIAYRYDLLNRVLSLGIDVGWRKTMLRLLRDKQPKQMLDVATGTADVALLAEKMLAPDSIIGIDISTGMLEFGREKVKKAQLTHKIKLETGDAENLQFETGAFDAITVAFGVRNFENLELGLREMHRVLKQNGVLAVLEFSQPQIFPFKQIYNFYFKYILPLIGRLTSQDPKAYTYLFESVQSFPQGERFLDILSQCGYKNATCKQLSLGICSIYIAEKKA